MKKHLFLIGVAVALAACAPSRQAMSSHPDHDAFVGLWYGESPQDEAMTFWVQNRCDNGTYNIIFVSIDGTEITRSLETGRWWLDGHRFYEVSSSRITGDPDVYDYLIVSPNEIFFRSIAMNYKFTDRRMQDEDVDKIKLPEPER